MGALLLCPMVFAVTVVLYLAYRENRSATSAPQQTVTKEQLRFITWLTWSKATVHSLAFWYFGSAFLITSPLLFMRNFGVDNSTITRVQSTTVRFSTFVETDLLALKHMMHASFLLGGMRAIAVTGNQRYLEIVAAVTLLSSLPSFVIMCLMISTNTSWLSVFISFGMFFVTAGSALASNQALMHSHAYLSVGTGSDFVPKSWGPWEALSSLPSRMGELHDYFVSLRGEGQLSKWSQRAREAKCIIFAEIVVHFVDTLSYLTRESLHDQYSSSVDTVVALVEATSLQLHFGFLLGNASHGLNSMTPSCLDMYCWGKTLLLFVMTASFLSGNHPGDVDIVNDAWQVAKIGFHTTSVLLVFRARNVLGQTILPFVETKYSCHNSKTSSMDMDKDHGLSLWQVATMHSTKTKYKSQDMCFENPMPAGFMFRWFWFGRAASIFSVLVWVILTLECGILPCLAETTSEIRRSFGVGANFSLHATAMYMLSQYRPVRDRREWGRSRLFNITMGAVFVVLFVFQISGCVYLLQLTASNHRIFSMADKSSLPLHQIILFNLVRLGVYAGLTGSFFMVPSVMPKLTDQSSKRASDYQVSHQNEESAAQMSMQEKATGFVFIQWNGSDGTYSGSIIFSLPRNARLRILSADWWTRLAWFWWLVLVFALLRGTSGFWLGSGESNFMNVGSISMPGSIAFHFLFILTGYSLRGVRSVHVPMLNFSSLTCACVSVVSAGSVIGCVREDDWMLMLLFLATMLVMTIQSWRSWQASEVMQQNRALFPQPVVSHNWM